MNIVSSVFIDNQEIPKKYTCEGDNVNPPLRFEDVPEQSQSLALIVEDPDAPAGLWTHWVIYNMPPNVFRIDEGSVPEKTLQGKGSSGNAGYEGPCPPNPSPHRYLFRLFALDTELPLSAGSVDRLTLLKAMEGHILEETTLLGLYTGPAKRP